MDATTRNPTGFAIVGIAAALLFAVLWTVAAKADPSWVFGENTLSDLGVSDVRMSACMFNYGCVVTGALVLVFGAGKALCETGYSRGSGALIAVAGAFLLLVGVFNKDYGNGDPHLFVAYAFFLFLVLAALFSILGDAAEERRLNACVTGALIALCIAVAAGNTLAYTEAVTVACGLVWIAAESAKMLVGPGKAAALTC